MFRKQQPILITFGNFKYIPEHLTVLRKRGPPSDVEFISGPRKTPETAANVTEKLFTVWSLTASEKSLGSCPGGTDSWNNGFLISGCIYSYGKDSSTSKAVLAPAELTNHMWLFKVKRGEVRSNNNKSAGVSHPPQNTAKLLRAALHPGIAEQRTLATKRVPKRDGWARN